MDQEHILQQLEAEGVVMRNTHVVLKSGKHAGMYVNKDEAYTDTQLTSRMCRSIAERFRDANVEVVVGPAIGGVILSQWTAHHLTKMTGRKVVSVYAEREEQVVLKAEEAMTIRLGDKEVQLEVGDEVVVKKPRFIMKRGYDQRVSNKNVLAVEDVLTTGDSAQQTILAARANGGEFVGAGVIWNRGGVTTHNLADVPRVEALVNMPVPSWSEEECQQSGPCSEGMPINTRVGHGREFLARKQQSS